jgi:hypothetical protein
LLLEFKKKIMKLGGAHVPEFSAIPVRPDSAVLVPAKKNV